MRTDLLDVLARLDMHAVRIFIFGFATGAILDTLAWLRVVVKLRRRMAALDAWTKGREAALRYDDRDN